MATMIHNGLMLLVLIVTASGSQLSKSTRPFDEFGDIGCEAEMAHLDNFAIQLQQDPKARGVIIFYGGKTLRGKFPRRGDAAARAARLKPYLVNRRGIPADQIVIIDGGYTRAWRVEVWIVPPGAQPPAPHPTIPVGKMRFRKGKANPRDYRCQV